MSDLTSSLGPIQSSDRINSLDILRGVALLGILLMNIIGFGLVFMAYGDPTVQGGADGWNLKIWIINNMLFEGTMRAMFSMLFGVGMVLMTIRMENRGGGIEVADIYYRRTIWLLIFGVIHAYLLLWAGEILFAYGLFGLFLFPFRHTKPRKLYMAVAFLTLFGVGLQTFQYFSHMENLEKFELAQEYSEDEDIPQEIKKGKEAWEGMVDEMKPGKQKVHHMTEAMHQGYFELLLYVGHINHLVQTTYNYDYNPWDVLPMMLLGIALYRKKVITAELTTKSYLVMMLIGYGMGLSINYYETQTLLDNNFSVESVLTTGLTYHFGRIAVAFGHIALVMLFCKASFLGFLKSSLAAVGKMALTNYVMHSVICAFIFTGIGFSMFGQLKRFELYYVVIAIWLFQLAVSPLWLRYFRFGPLEWVWRSLIYGKRPAFKR
ncbi:MAG: DUF418 domain-containing protein [Cyclobacteriaceae bacterium]